MTQSSWIGKTLNERYEILELLGQGGMSAVYKANDPNLRRVVAIKLIHAHLSQDAEFVRRFEEEAAAVAQLRHPNLIQVYDFNHDGETYYIVFEFVPGETVQDRLKRMKKVNRQMDVAEVSEIVAESADGLQYAHSKGLIHRDIKPANIMLNVTGDPIIMDFGIAKIMGGTQHTATGAVLGTARYMSPEQIKGERIGPSTDIYSLGVTLFEMLGGRPPFEADSAMTLMMMHMTDPVPNLQDLRADVPTGLVAVVNKALAKDSADRYQTAAEFAAALRSYDDTAAAPFVAATTLQPSVPETIDPDATVLEPVTSGDPSSSGGDTGAAAAAGTAAAAATGASTASATTPTPSSAGTGTAPTPPLESGVSRTMLYAAGGIVLLLLIALGVWAIFFRGPGDGDEVAGGGVEATPVLTETADSQATIQAGVVQTSEAVATQTAEAFPTGTQEPEATATEEAVEPTEVPPGQSVGAVGQVAGDVVMVGPGGEEIPVTADTPIVAGAQFITGDDGQLQFTLEDESIIQVVENSDLTLDAVADDPADTNQQTDFILAAGDLLLRQPEPGNELTVFSPAGDLISTLQKASSSAGAAKQIVAAKRAQQAEADEAAMAVHFEEDVAVIISCFSGVCLGGDGNPIAPGWEVAASSGGALMTDPITSQSESYRQWQEKCDNCLVEAPEPIVETPTLPPSPTAAFTPTAEATATTAATATTVATATEEAPDLSSRITNITLENGTYIVSYETVGFTEQLPGQHVHFYFDTVSEANAGVPGSGPWKLYGGPRPFTQYSEAERGAATAMCIRVANADHSIIYGSGNCYPLP